ncbi:polysaccharide biosynthesis tyrosine autokinase [Nibrella saemangeumensis]|uniref:polysaccharide biosynthesis tyrosine autokinase n=1 Tax=Nibrella saemangeumensis TaxID=1084526 RepID=UPI0031F051B0
MVTFFVVTPLKYSYNVRASIVILDDENAAEAGNREFMQQLDIFSSAKIVENEIEILRSYTLARKVVENLGLDVDYTVKDGLKTKDIFKRSPVKLLVHSPDPSAYDEPFEVELREQEIVIDEVSHPYNRPVQTPLGRVTLQRNDSVPIHYNTLQITLRPKNVTVKSYVDRLRVSQASRSSSVLYLNLEDTAPDRGEAYLNRLIHFYDLVSLQQKNQVATNTLRFVEDRLGIISNELRDVEREVQSYKARAGIVDLSAESSLFLAKAQETDKELSTINLQLGALQELDRYIGGKTSRSNLAPATLGLADPTLNVLVGTVLDLEVQREKLVKTVPETTPAVEALDNQIRLTKANLADNISALRKILVNNQQKLQTNNRQVESLIRTVPEKERVLLEISRRLGIKTNLYNFLLQKREETALSYAAAVSNIRVVDPALANHNPSRPVKKNFYAFALVLGLLIPVAGFWLADFLNTKLSRKAQVEAAVEAPIVGEIIQSNTTDPLQITATSRTILAEQIRTLRTNLQFFDTANDGSRCILITSSVSGEGKSFISLNLGASLAFTGKRVILLELDMRKPKLHRYLNGDKTFGLSNYLAGQVELESIVQSVVDYQDLYFLPCGPVPPNPSELLSSSRMRQLFAELRQQFDVILIDTPPIGLVSDAQILAPHADITLYVLRYLYTNKSYLRNVAAYYKEKRFKNLALLVNGIQAGKDFDYSYGYGYDGYSYDYRNGYHVEEKVNGKAGHWYNRFIRLKDKV